ncbi:hypothetical protein NT6N_04040 [Oceaniferula spumae]|uniref:Uncharacterized protein n=1 Tax=Oceaniferula spumae TaxID=2979115 RepID=A0AAT9FHC7_9BACT
MTLAEEMEEPQSDVVEMRLDKEIGLSGHPGLAADIYSLPIDRPGIYRFEATPSSLEDYHGVAEIRVLHVDTQSFEEDTSNRRTGVSIETHGGAVVSERSHLSDMREYFDEADFDRGSDNETLWNRFADGFSSTHTEQLSVPGGASSRVFAFFPCDEYLAVTPLLNEGDVCGYLLQCRCGSRGERSATTNTAHQQRLTRRWTPRPDPLRVESAMTTQTINPESTLALRSGLGQL